MLQAEEQQRSHGGGRWRDKEASGKQTPMSQATNHQNYELELGGWGEASGESQVGRGPTCWAGNLGCVGSAGGRSQKR